MPQVSPPPQAPPRREHVAVPSAPAGRGQIVINDDTIIEAHDLALKKERNDEWYVGREDLGSFVALPEIWAQAVIYMATKNPFTESYPSFAAIKAFIRVKSRGDEEFHAELDREVRILVSQLIRHRLVRAIGGRVIEELSEKRDLLPSIRKRHVAWFFRPKMLIAQAVFGVAGCVVLFADPALRPHLSHYFWSDYPGLTLLTAIASAWLLTLQHEMFHVLSARAANLSGTLSFSTRGPSLIMEANIHNLPKVHPRWMRQVVYGSGILADLLVVSCCTVLLSGLTYGVLTLPWWAVGILRQVILLRLLGLLWQGVLLYKTDPSSMLQSWMGDPNLHRKATAWMRELIDFIRHPIPKTGPIHRHQRVWPIAHPQVRRYALIMVLSSAVSGGIFIACKVALISGLIRQAGATLGSGFSGHVAALADGVLVVLLLGWMLAMNIRARVRPH